MIKKKGLILLRAKYLNRFLKSHSYDEIIKWVEVLVDKGSVEQGDIGVYKFEGKQLKDEGLGIGVLELVILQSHEYHCQFLIDKIDDGNSNSVDDSGSCLYERVHVWVASELSVL